MPPTRSRDINLTPHSRRVGAVRAAMAHTREISSQDGKNTGDQAGREWQPRTSRMQTGTHIDLEEMKSRAINCHPHPNGIGHERQIGTATASSSDVEPLKFCPTKQIGSGRGTLEGPVARLAARPLRSIRGLGRPRLSPTPSHSGCAQGPRSEAGRARQSESP